MPCHPSADIGFLDRVERVVAQDLQEGSLCDGSVAGSCPGLDAGENFRLWVEVTFGPFPQGRHVVRFGCSGAQNLACGLPSHTIDQLPEGAGTVFVGEALLAHSAVDAELDAPDNRTGRVAFGKDASHVSPRTCVRFYRDLGTMNVRGERCPSCASRRQLRRSLRWRCRPDCRYLSFYSPFGLVFIGASDGNRTRAISLGS